MIDKLMNVFLERCESYELNEVRRIMRVWTDIFQQHIRPGDHVVLKPNWLAASHKFDKAEWESVITHPSVITAVLEIALQCLRGQGRVTITDGPQTDSQWEAIMQRMTPSLWQRMGNEAGVEVSVVDLRLDEWTNENDVTVAKRSLPGDPLGSVICELNEYSEFINHSASTLGYYGADYDKAETNEAHSGRNHKYKVSASAIDADVFINIPKMKTHKKAGITCALKNLVGINTYKNWLPHHNEGTPAQGGDQFPDSGAKNRAEAFLIERFKSFLVRFPSMGKAMIPVKNLGRLAFGDTRETIRSGNWYGNDTLWRMVIDLNKVLLYANTDGSLRGDSLDQRKRYIAIVDGIVAGDGKGPEAPDRVDANLLILGTNPVSVDACCAKAMGFDWRKIPSLARAFLVDRYKLVDFQYGDIRIKSDSESADIDLAGWVRPENFRRFTPHFGWTGHIESDR
jgi:uncharacterized protein (DUF362 family)